MIYKRKGIVISWLITDEIHFTNNPKSECDSLWGDKQSLPRMLISYQALKLAYFQLPYLYCLRFLYLVVNIHDCNFVFPLCESNNKLVYTVIKERILDVFYCVF